MIPYATRCVNSWLLSSLSLLVSNSCFAFSSSEGHHRDWSVTAKEKMCVREWNAPTQYFFSEHSTSSLNSFFCIENSLRWTKVVFLQIWSPLRLNLFLTGQAFRENKAEGEEPVWGCWKALPNASKRETSIHQTVDGWGVLAVVSMVFKHILFLFLDSVKMGCWCFQEQTLSKCQVSICL